MSFAFDPGDRPSLEIAGAGQRFPIHRIYCVGGNYAAHAREMGANDREPPFFFCKPADAIVENGIAVPYPSRTVNLHHEIELVVAIGKAGRDIAPADASNFIFGYAVGVDLTRRDLQNEAKDSGKPWDPSKGFDHSAPITAIHRVADTGIIEKGRIWLRLNGALRQEGDIADMIWPVADAIAELSTLFALIPGDLIFTGTPSGVGPILPGDQLVGGVEGVDELRFAVIGR
jgi:fumarylpyruvate hydrolase